MVKITKNRTFIFKYEPLTTPRQLFAEMWKAVDTGKPNIQPKNVMKSNSLEAIYRCITPSRWEIFTCLVEKKPTNLTELAQLLKKDYSNVWKDIRALKGLEIIKLKKIGKEIKPIALYERIIFDLPVHQKKELLIDQVQVEKKFDFLRNFNRKTNLFGVIHIYSL